jgi:hypothetical protein
LGEEPTENHMHLGRHEARIDEARLMVSQSEREALIRAEQICSDADQMLRDFVARCDIREREADSTLAEARAEAKRIRAEARVEVARLIRDAITLVDAAIADARTGQEGPEAENAGTTPTWVAHPAPKLRAI